MEQKTIVLVKLLGLSMRDTLKKICHRYVIDQIRKFEKTGSVCNKAKRQSRKRDENSQIEMLGYFVSETTTSIHKMLLFYQNRLR